MPMTKGETAQVIGAKKIDKYGVVVVFMLRQPL